jgi:hypothetical protein
MASLKSFGILGLILVSFIGCVSISQLSGLLATEHWPAPDDLAPPLKAISLPGDGGLIQQAGGPLAGRDFLERGE